MATVHPSRLGLVPQAAPSRPAPPPPVSREDELRQRLLDRKRQDGRGDSRGSDHNDRPRDYDSRDESRGDDVRRSGRDHRDGRGGEGRRRAEDGEESGRGDRRRRTSRSPQRHERDPAYRSQERDDRSRRDDRPNDRSRDDREERSRRASPSYNAYTAPQHGNGAGPGYGPGAGGLGQSAPWQDIRNGMPPFPPRGPPRGGGGGGWNDPMDLERRRQERDNMTLTVWPPSPKEPFRDDEELAADRKAAKKKSKKSKSKSKRRSKYSSDSDSTDSEEERRRRKRKERRRERKSKKYSESESESDDERERRKRRRKSSEKRSRRTEERDEEDQWVEKGGEVALKPKSIETARVVPVAAPPPLDDSDEEVGPQLPVDHSARDRTHRSAYANMGRGEGEAMAAFVASGERIPRRGEIGMEAEVIDKFEKSGYVMSGSRHQRMNAVRMRKENQVINAEEKRAILKLQREEKDKKEGAIVAQFREMLQDNLAKQAGKG